jgi:hypothetical protein
MRRLIIIGFGLALALGLGAPRHPPAAEDPEFKIGVMASLSGGFAIAAKDSIDGVEAWAKNRGLPGKKIVFETLDDETNRSTPPTPSAAWRRTPRSR